MSERKKAERLHVEGTHLVDRQGNVVQLRGISTHGIQLYPQYMNRACLKQLRDQFHINVIRLAMYTAEDGGYCTNGNQEEIRDLIRKSVALASSLDLYVIIDWHILFDNNPAMNKEAALEFFDIMAKEMAGQENIIYEICNEPNGDTTWQQVKDYAAEVIPIIRGYDPDSVIVVGTPHWSQRIDEAVLDPITEYQNIMYTFHFYAGTHMQELRDVLEDAVKKGLPVFVTEYGICEASGNGKLDKENAQKWISLMDQYQISYIQWNLSNKDESSAIIRPECTIDSDFTDQDITESGLWLKDMLTAHIK